MMTRANRPGETDKTSISDEEFCTLDTNGGFVVVNNLYGVRYGTPLRGILSPLTRGNVPILDYPLDTVESLKRPEYDTLKFYIYPPSIVSWRNRVESSERNDSGRLEAGTRELGSLAISGFIHPNIDISIINEDGAANVSAQQIIEVVEEVVG
ncbi:hypothetical protein IT397_03530 [Candidatus Nomurabacteria bacterium]|nr:hypothetical protein [Candidatus Nomurabacteria bacterium]